MSAAESATPLPARTDGAQEPAPAVHLAGDSASSEAMARLKAAVGDMKAAASKPLIDQSLAALKAGDWPTAAQWAIKALDLDERNGVAWWLLAISREKCGDVRSALACFEAALKLLPDQRAIANDLGRLAFRLKMPEMAEKLFGLYLLHQPGHPEAANNLACALRDQQRYAEAIDVLKPVIMAEPQEPLLWNTLGTVMNEQGQLEQALTFYDEALRLRPTMATARYNRGNARLSHGDTPGALEDVVAALPHASAAERPMMELARALALMSSGELETAFDAYEIRLDPAFPGVTNFLVDRPRWTPETEVAGKSILVIGEQGLGDEVMFGSMLPDLVEALGPDGRLTLAVEPRLVPLFQRSFPEAEVGAHATYDIDAHLVRVTPFKPDLSGIDAWTPLASLSRRWRRSLEAFPTRKGYLTPDPARVAHWREQLAALGDGPKVGILWKSLKMNAARSRYFSPFEQWRTVLKTPGVRFVNLQYGDCAEELAAARAEGLEIWSPPGIDLKQDLDDVAALTAALDITLGPSNATTQLSSAVGAETWMISTPGAWPMLGADRQPWQPAARVFFTEGLNDWTAVMGEIAAELARRAGTPSP